MTGVTTANETMALVCAECGDPFGRTPAEQQYYDQRAAQAPETCPTCRVQLRASRNAQMKAAHAEGAREALTPAPSRTFGAGGRHGPSGSGGATRGPGGEPRLFQAVCAECGRATEVPFRPRSGRPVFCRDCYNARNGR